MVIHIVPHPVKRRKHRSNSKSKKAVFDEKLRTEIHDDSSDYVRLDFNKCFLKLLKYDLKNGNLSRLPLLEMKDIQIQDH